MLQRCSQTCVSMLHMPDGKSAFHWLQGLAQRQIGQVARQYKQLLEALNGVAHRQVEAWLAAVPELTEPYVARCISETLPSGPLPFFTPKKFCASCCNMSQAEASQI